VWDRFKSLFVGKGDSSLGNMYDKSKRLGYQQMLSQINTAKNCNELPLIRQWDTTAPADVMSNNGNDTELIGNLINQRIENKRKELQLGGQFQ
jgi:hypothetical protein